MSNGMYEQSQWFYRAFNAVFAEGSPHRQQAVDTYTDNTGFTAFITLRINEIIGEKGYIAQNEYYRIDAMGYTSRRKELSKNKALSAHLWDLEIAVEHENSSKDWLDEVIKLAHICCPLRVVIGYVPRSQRERGDEIRLAYAADALGQLKCRDNLKNGEFLVILGNSETDRKEENFFNYKPYVLNPRTFLFEPLDICGGGVL